MAEARASERRLRVVTVGGGTGQYNLLTGLRTLPVDLTAIVTMMDSGGSSGKLRHEYGVLPPGDFTRCLVALSQHPDAMTDLLEHRFQSGTFGGHTVRNLLFTALQEMTGDPAKVVDRLHEIFAVRARVEPVTLDRVELVMHLANDQVFRGEATIDNLGELLPAPVLSLYLDPAATAYTGATDALRRADVIIFGPGDLYTSVIPNLLVDGVCEAIAESSARVVYVCNLMTKRNETPGFAVEDFVATIAMYLRHRRLDAVLVNSQWPDEQLTEYAAEESEPVRIREAANTSESLYVTRDLVTDGRLVRHDPMKIAHAVQQLASRWFGSSDGRRSGH